MNYKNLFHEAGILDPNSSIPGEFVRQPFGWSIRNLYVDKIKNLLLEKGYEERHFTDFLSEKGVEIMENEIMSVKKKIYPIYGVSSNNKTGGSYYLAPTHEISVSETMKRRLKHEDDLPLLCMHIGPAFRKQYDRKFPFGLSKRNNYIEIYNIQKTKEEAHNQIEDTVSLTRNIIGNILQLPFVESIRPQITNNPVAKQTIGMDVITSFNRTLHSGMIYLQEDIFSKAFGVEYYNKSTKKFHNPHIVHFGFTDNLMMASILHSFDLGNNEKLILPDTLTPNHIIATSQDTRNYQFMNLKKELEIQGIRTGIIRSHEFGNPRNKKIIDQINIQNPYIHIQSIDDNGNINYRIQGENERKTARTNELITDTQKVKAMRHQILENKKIEIQNNRVVNCQNNLNAINNLIKNGYIVETFLDNLDSTIISFDKYIQGGEILGLNKSNEIGKCVYSGKQTYYKALLSKRL